MFTGLQSLQCSGEMKRIRQTDHHGVESGISEHLIVAAEHLSRRILQGKPGPPFFAEIACGVQMAEAGSVNSFCMPFTRPTQADDTNLVFVHDLPKRNNEKSRDANAKNSASIRPGGRRGDSWSGIVVILDVFGCGPLAPLGFYFCSGQNADGQGSRTRK